MLHSFPNNCLYSFDTVNHSSLACILLLAQEHTSTDSTKGLNIIRRPKTGESSFFDEQSNFKMGCLCLAPKCKTWFYFSVVLSFLGLQCAHVWSHPHLRELAFFPVITLSPSVRWSFKMALGRGYHWLFLSDYDWLALKQQLYVNGSWREKEAHVLDFGICLQVLHLDIFCVHISQTKTASAKFHNKW